MARGGRGAAPRTPRPTPRKVTRERLSGTAADVWVSYHLVGATVASALHDCAKRTVYRHVDDVEADSVQLAAATAMLAARRASREERTAQLLDAAHEALIAKIRGGKVHVRWLVEMVMPQGVALGKSSGPALQVPAFFLDPREDAPAAPSPPAPSRSAEAEQGHDFLRDPP